ncbi:MAG: ribonuclease P protein component [Sporichthyaceae bacterium]|nr:ribonuclease P protein component [Sporichthyaceae bacterium]
MLAAGNRLRRRDDFATAVRRGRRAGRPLLVVHMFVGSSSSPTEPAGGATSTPRFGFVVGRAVGPAVTRNTVRRRLRHLARTRLAALPPDAWVVVRALPAAAGATSVELAGDLDGALDRLLLKDRSTQGTVAAPASGKGQGGPA